MKKRASLGVIRLSVLIILSTFSSYQFYIRKSDSSVCIKLRRIISIGYCWHKNLDRLLKVPNLFIEVAGERINGMFWKTMETWFAKIWVYLKEKRFNLWSFDRKLNLFIFQQMRKSYNSRQRTIHRHRAFLETCMEIMTHHLQQIRHPFRIPKNWGSCRSVAVHHTIRLSVLSRDHPAIFRFTALFGEQPWKGLRKPLAIEDYEDLI